jgi:DNA-binding winged helix-turn-helix (wHTH) protein
VVFLLGDVVLDSDRFELVSSGVPVHVEPRVLELLIYLIQHRDRLVTKEELLQHVWRDADITEAALHRAIERARRVLAVSGREDPIRTVYGRGYRFAGDVEERAARLEPEGDQPIEKAAVSAGWRSHPGWTALGLFAAIALLAGLGLKVSRFARASRPTEDPLARLLCTRARGLLEKREPHGFHGALELFQRASRLDPNNPSANAGLADTHLLMVLYGVEPRGEGFPRAKAAARRALALDGDSSEALAAQGYVRLHVDWDLNGAGEDLGRAVMADVASPTAHQRYAWFLLLRRRAEQALQELRRALELRPHSLSINADLGLLLYYARLPDEAVVQFRKAIAMYPDFVPLHLYLSAVYLHQEKYPEALEEFDVISRRTGGAAAYDSPEGVRELRQAFESGGASAFWRAWLAHALKSPAATSAEIFAGLYLRVGETASTLRWLERAISEQAPGVLYLKVDPAWDPVRSEPRFQELVKRVGLDPS